MRGFIGDTLILCSATKKRQKTNQKNHIMGGTDPNICFQNVLSIAQVSFQKQLLSHSLKHHLHLEGTH